MVMNYICLQFNNISKFAWYKNWKFDDEFNKVIQ